MASKNIRELKNIITQMDALLPTLADKPTKAADVLIEKASAIKALINLEAEERETEQDARIKELEAQHEADARRITELERANAALCARPLPEAIKVPDPEHAAVRQENARLSDLLKTIADSSTTEHERATMAIRVIQHCSADAAKVFLPMLGLDYKQYAMMMLNYKSERELCNIVERAVNGDGPLSRFARARLAVDFPIKMIHPKKTSQPFVPDMRSAEEKIAEAKAMTRQKSEVLS